MGGGGNFFGSLSSALQDLNMTLDPVMRYVDPIGSFAVRETDKTMVKLFNPKMPDMPTGGGTLLTDKAGSSNARAGGASSGASTTGGGAKDMVTAPPNTPEGNKMRFGQTTFLGVTQ